MMPQPKRIDQSDDGGSHAIGLDFNLPEALPYISYLRKATRHLLQEVGVSGGDIDDLETMIGELATNAARHAKGGNYHVSIEVHNDQVTITVTDSGVGFEPSGVQAPGSTRIDDLSEEDDLRFGGFGLPLVQLLADQVSIERNQPKGMIIRAKKTVASRAEEDPKKRESDRE